MSRRTLLLMLVVLGLSLPGLWFISVRTLIPVWRWLGSNTWVKTPCTLIRSEHHPMRRNQNDMVVLDLEYRYASGGVLRTGTAFDFAPDAPRGNSASAVVRPEGTTICYVNPHDPADAVLSRDWNRSYLIGMFGMIWLVLPFSLAVISLRGQGIQRPKA